MVGDGANDRKAIADGRTCTRATEANMPGKELAPGTPPVPDEIPDDGDARPPWVAIATPRRRSSTAPVSWRPVIIQVAMTAFLIIGLVAVAGTVEARRTAEREAVDAAMRTTDVLVRAAVQPAITDDLLVQESNTSAQAFARLDAVVRGQVLTDTVVRVKLWNRDGRVVYSDEPRLVNDVFPLDPNEIEALRAATSIGSISDLQQAENRFERPEGKLVEVYYPVWTPSGEELLFETYVRYDQVITRSDQGVGTFAAVAVGALLLMLMVQMPLSWAMIARLRRVQDQRHHLLTGALTASAEERRRIAGTLHDGVVQDLAAASFIVAGSADQARGAGQEPLGERLDVVANTLRTSIRALRSLLVDIYPPSLRTAGLPAALDDLAATLSTPGVAVTITAEPDLSLSQDGEAVIYAVAQECLRNAARHARATTITVRVARVGALVRLEVSDDGIGFDPRAVLDEPRDGHFGLRVIRDLSADYGAMLAVASRPGGGTTWRLEVPADVQ
jgi:signal transduction histidine kinase